MAWKGRSLALAVLVLTPSGVLADDDVRSQQARQEGGQHALFLPEIPLPPEQWMQGTAYGFSNDDQQSVKFASFDRVFEESGECALLLPEIPLPPEQRMRGTAYGFSNDDQQAVRFACLDHPPAVALHEADDEPAVAQDSLPAIADLPLVTRGETCSCRDVATRLGWWFVDSQGDPTKVGEYQGLGSSAFWDIDVLSSNGEQTIDLIATGLDSEGTQVGLSVFGPQLSMDVDYQRFLHRLDHDPLTNMGELTSTEEIIGEDLDVGEDYAVRIQDLRYVVKGRVTKNTKARVNFRVLRKFGERQTNTVQHCADSGAGRNRTCHVLSRRQRIDWLTVKIEPIVESRLGPVRAEYSRPMRFFSQNDQLLTANFGDFHVYGLGEEIYAVVPDSFSQVDRLKLGVDLGASTNFYASSHIRDTHNKFRETHRKSYGFDLRLTNRSWDGVKLNAYATLNEQTNQNVPFLFPEEEIALGVKTALVPPYGIRHPIDYFRRTVGADVSWRPFRRGSTLRGLSLTAGTEQGRIERKYAAYVVQDLDDPPGPVVDQERTEYISGYVDASLRWSPGLDTFVRYKLRATRAPLFGVNRYTGYTNTSLPDREDLVEIGGTWMPAETFLASATFGLENRANFSDIAIFEEDDYPITCTLWYAPTPEWSLSAGYGYYSNWIDQDISFPSDDPAIQTGDVRRWNYGGRGQVFSFGSEYAWCEYLLFLAGVEFVQSRDAFDPLEPWPDLPFYSDVVVDRTRVTAGIDWLVDGEISTYFRYIFEDYEDKSVDYNSGTAHMFLAGFSAIY